MASLQLLQVAVDGAPLATDRGSNGSNDDARVPSVIPINAKSDHIVIGRSKKEAQVYLHLGGNQHTISRRHAELFRRGKDVYIKDLGSLNGIFVNNVKVAETVLRDGDVVQLGGAAGIPFGTVFIGEHARVRYRFRDPEAGGSPRAAAAGDSAAAATAVVAAAAATMAPFARATARSRTAAGIGGGVSNGKSDPFVPTPGSVKRKRSNASVGGASTAGGKGNGGAEGGGAASGRGNVTSGRGSPRPLESRGQASSVSHSPASYDVAVGLAAMRGAPAHAAAASEAAQVETATQAAIAAAAAAEKGTKALETELRWAQREARRLHEEHTAMARERDHVVAAQDRTTAAAAEAEAARQASHVGEVARREAELRRAQREAAKLRAELLALQKAQITSPPAGAAAPAEMAAAAAASAGPAAATRLELEEGRERAAAGNATIHSLLAEVSCPLCGGYILDAAIVPCSHGFCRSCWRAHLAGRSAGAAVACPVCQKTFNASEAAPRGSMNLDNVVDLLVAAAAPPAEREQWERRQQEQHQQQQDQSQPEREEGREAEREGEREAAGNSKEDADESGPQEARDAGGAATASAKAAPASATNGAKSGPERVRGAPSPARSSASSRNSEAVARGSGGGGLARGGRGATRPRRVATCEGCNEPGHTLADCPHRSDGAAEEADGGSTDSGDDIESVGSPGD